MSNARDIADWLIEAEKTTPSDHLPTSGGELTGPVITSSTFDGRDVAADGETLDLAPSTYDPIGASVAMAIALGG